MKATKPKRTILVTGGAGYIGSHTLVALLEQGDQVVVVDNLVNSSRESLRRVEKITGQKIKFYQADLRDRSALIKIFQEHHFDWVIHFAGLKAVGESVREPLKYYDNNLGSTLALLVAMEQGKCHRLVFSSSATVYGVPEKLPLTEDSRLGTTNPYGATKLMIEQILTDFQKAHADWTVVILRYFNPVGAHPSGLLGENPQGVPNNLTPFIAQVATGQRAELKIFGADYETPDGTGVRDYLHVCDLATGHRQAINQCDQPGCYVYNLGTGHGASVLDVLHAFEKAVGHKLPYKIEARRAGDVPACYADASKAQRELKWEAKRSLDEMCASLWHFYQLNPRGYESD